MRESQHGIWLCQMACLSDGPLPQDDWRAGGLGEPADYTPANVHPNPARIHHAQPKPARNAVHAEGLSRFQITSTGGTTRDSQKQRSSGRDVSNQKQQAGPERIDRKMSTRSAEERWSRPLPPNASAPA